MYSPIEKISPTFTMSFNTFLENYSSTLIMWFSRVVSDNDQLTTQNPGDNLSSG